MVKSTRPSAISLLTEKTADSEKRIAALEKRVADLERGLAESGDEDLEGLLGSRYGYFGDDDSDPVEPPAVVLKRGRRPRIPPGAFAWRRDELVHFVELRWPKLLGQFNERRSLENLLQTLKSASPGASDVWAYRQLTEHIGILWQFLQSGRYKGEPRQIAYAMAGLPQLTWRSSLDYCNRNPSPLPINLAAFADHIRRHSPKCFDALQTDGPTPQNLRLLRTCCEDCRRLATRPDRVSRALQVGCVG